MSEEKSTYQKHKESWYLNTPVHEESFHFLFVSIPKRVLGLLSKAIGVKMLMFGIATSLFISMPEHFPWYAWIIAFVLTMFGKDGLRFIEYIKK